MWKIDAIQVAKKVGARKYVTEMIGRKRLLGFKDARGRWRRA
jgi:hypothetical protein